MLEFLPKLPRWLPYVVGFLAVGTAVPFGLIARSRQTLSEDPRIHIIRDMDNQERFKAQQGNELFADDRAMRPPIPGTVARGELRLDTHFFQGRVSQGDGSLVWAETFPEYDDQGQKITLDRALFERGQQRFNIYCAVCHGRSGYGDGPVERRVKILQGTGVPGTATWASPANYHTQQIRGQTVGELFNTVTNGKKNMAGYESQIPTRDRWAIVFYVKALMRSQNPE